MSRAARAQRGVALITAVLIVALATMLAVERVGFKGYLDQRRSANDVRARSGLRGRARRRSVGRGLLRRDKQQSAKTDDFTEEWATPIPPIPIEGGEVRGPARRHAGPLQSQQPGDARRRPAQGRSAWRSSASSACWRCWSSKTKWAKIIADWIDSDIDAEFPDGAEDPTYTGLTPPYRTANMPHHAHQRAAGDRRLRPRALPQARAVRHALPIGTAINVCTASPELLDSLVGGQRQFTLARENMTETRKQRCFPSKQDFEQPLIERRRSRSCSRARSSTQTARTSARRSGSLLALLSSPCTVSCIAAATARISCAHTKKPRNALMPELLVVRLHCRRRRDHRRRRRVDRHGRQRRATRQCAVRSARSDAPPQRPAAKSSCSFPAPTCCWPSRCCR